VVVEEIGRWMQVNGEAIFATRPWKIFGEGPSLANAKPLTGQGFNEGAAKGFTAEDIRFTSKGDVLYATFFGWPENRKVVIKSLAKNKYKEITKVELLGSHANLSYTHTDEGLIVELPDNKDGLNYTNVLKIK
jgi:alpha-L-fucosidase